jgi:hypothetical protein
MKARHSTFVSGDSGARKPSFVPRRRCTARKRRCVAMIVTQVITSAATTSDSSNSMTPAGAT